MLTAALLIALRQEPTAYDKAMAAHRAAIKSIPVYTATYRMEKEGDDEKMDIELQCWKDGDKKASTVSLKGEEMMRTYTLGTRGIFVSRQQKIYSEATIDPKTEEPPLKPLAEGEVRMSFESDLAFDFRSNPAFRVTSETDTEVEGKKARTIAFEAEKADHSGSIKGTATFSLEAHILLNLRAETFGNYHNVYTVSCTKFDTTTPPDSVFRFDLNDFPGYQKVDPPSNGNRSR